MMAERQEDPEGDMMAAFKTFDRNGDGFISLSELKFVMTQLGEKLTDDEYEQMLDAVDLDRDGRINYSGTQ